MAFKQILSKGNKAGFPELKITSKLLRFNRAFTSKEESRTIKVLFDVENGELAFIFNQEENPTDTFKISKATGTVSSMSISPIINYEKLSKVRYLIREKEIDGEKAYYVKLEYQNE